MEKKINDFNWKVAGIAGDGILNAGLAMFARTCMHAGLHVFASAEYPSLIRGGHNHLDVRVSDKKIPSHKYELDLLVALNMESFEKHFHKLSTNGAMLYDPDDVKGIEEKAKERKLYAVPLMKIATESGGRIMRNTVAMGATFALLGMDVALLDDSIKNAFGKKGGAVVDGNIKAAQAGYDYVKKNFTDDFAFKLVPGNEKGLLFVSGNEAIALGATKAGCKMICAYPMTPASSVMTTLEKFQNEANLVVKQAESETAAINMVVGASYAGIRAMTATSGGGFALMVEGFGLAMQMEAPIVVVESMRPGPATGLATHSGQGDLRYVLHASTDEAPRVIIAPGDPEECFYLTIDAFNLAEKYQLPVVIMSDKFLSESYSSWKQFDVSKVVIDRGLLLSSAPADYKRYEITESGVSPRVIPGVEGGMHVASSYEHDEYGSEVEGELNKIAMSQKRFRKLANLEKELPLPELVGNKDAELTIISWGSTKGAILQAMEDLKKEGVKINFLQVKYLNPLPVKRIEEVLLKAKKTVLIEGNQSGQLGGLIRENTGKSIDFKMLKYDGRPFYPSEIVFGLKNISSGKAEKLQVFSMNKLVASEFVGVKA